MIKIFIREKINEALKNLEIEGVDFSVKYSDKVEHGDFASNVAFVSAKILKENPKSLASKIKLELEKMLPEEIEKVEIASPGFLNFFLSKKFFINSLKEIIQKGDNYGRLEKLKGQKILFEYTDPNPFKVFHIGHLMSNTIGEALSRLSEWNGAEVKRMCYGGDVGLHIAKSVWGMMKNKNAFPQETDSLDDKVKFVGDSYVVGNNAYEDDEVSKNEILKINKEIFEFLNGKAIDENIEVFYKKGKAWSVNLFHQMYKLLGTNFDFEVFESEISNQGKEKVLEAKEQGVFEESEGAIVFKGEDYGLHTRVFINSEGLPTYEAKEVGLAFKKFELESWDKSVVITANEIKEYYKVFLKAMEKIDSKISEKTFHFTHGILKLPSGKMSSRKGSVISAQDFINEIKIDVGEKIKDRDYDEVFKEEVREKVSIGAFKYIILRQAIGKDVIYKKEEAVSFEGDSGPYLQYSLARAYAVLRNANKEGIEGKLDEEFIEGNLLEKNLFRFPEIIERAEDELAPQLLTTYLTALAGNFNSWYGNNVIVSKEQNSAYRVALTHSFMFVMQNGMKALGIPVLEKM